MTVYDNLKRGRIIIKKGATADVAKLAKSLNAAKGRGYIFSF